MHATHGFSIQGSLIGGLSRMGLWLAAALLLIAPAAAAEKDGHPDMSGFWNYGTVSTDDPVAQELLDALPEDTVFVNDAGGPEFPRGEFGGLDLKPHAREEAMQWSPEEELELRNICKMPSIIYAMQGPFPIAIHQGRDIIVIQLEYFDMVRVVFMDGRDHPPEDAPHSKLGHSVGHWDGDTLVVETTHLSPATITNNGLNHSENVRFVERFRLSDGGDKLLATQYFEDPDNLNEPGARLMAWKKNPDGQIYPYECDPFVYQE